MVKIELYLPIGYNTEDIKNAAAARLPIEKEEIKEIAILRSSLDLSDKSNIRYRLTVGLAFSVDREAGLLKMRKVVSPVPDLTLTVPHSTLKTRPVVVGAGPCGLFAALILAESGARPIILERGLPVEERKSRVARLADMGILDTECNVQFGEGGAGTYSDGKLKVGSMDKYKMKVLSEFVAAGATADITYSTTAHLGTDRLSSIVAALRNKIISLGGEFIYSARFSDFFLKDGELNRVEYFKNGERVTLDTDSLILAIGHSAKDTFEKLYSRGVRMAAKGFGIGVRIEHPREYINTLVYGKDYDKRLETASYHLVTHLKNGRSVYSFCMCPGGTVVAATSEESSVVTNGMSEYRRDGENSNAAFLVSLTPEDFPSDSALSGMELQRSIERAAFLAGGGGYCAPVARMENFIKNTTPTPSATVRPTYPVGTTPCAPEKYLPEAITSSLRAAIGDFNDWMPGFYYPDAVLTGAETRSTSPVRILRTECYELEGIPGILAAGEGAGYSGGIVSSAVDGVRCAMALISKHQ